MTVTNIDAARDKRGRRQRVVYADADTIRERTQSAAAALKLRGARRLVLDAVLKLLTGWSRIADDQLAIRHIANVLPVSYDPKTIGRALKSLAANQLIEYRPARGRGRHATVAIHPRFTTGISPVKRDDSTGKVVTFSPAASYKGFQKKNLTHQATVQHRDRKRPVGVKVDRPEIDRVMTNLDAGYQSMPRHLRYLLGRAVCRALARGFRPDQILDVLNAQFPTVEVNRPYKLAIWRLRQNLIGAGPRLEPLQRAWDRANSDATHAAYAAAEQRATDEITAVTTSAVRQRMINAIAARLNLTSVDPVAATRQAARIARREHPELKLADAITRWLAANEPAGTALVTPTSAPSASGPAAHTCISCSREPGVIRHELPLKSAVCDECWNTPIDTDEAA